mmetsp:Transcript_21892/g.57127  ORF Transcript_21892/g.57127 Transcript_21892/m.57127 type:complete len:436 (-) Transcript_21892:2925-4232(-)
MAKALASNMTIFNDSLCGRCDGARDIGGERGSMGQIEPPRYHPAKTCCKVALSPSMAILNDSRTSPTAELATAGAAMVASGSSRCSSPLSLTGPISGLAALMALMSAAIRDSYACDNEYPWGLRCSSAVRAVDAMAAVTGLTAVTTVMAGWATATLASPPCCVGGGFGGAKAGWYVSRSLMAAAYAAATTPSLRVAFWMNGALSVGCSVFHVFMSLSLTERSSARGCSALALVKCSVTYSFFGSSLDGRCLSDANLIDAASVPSPPCSRAARRAACCTARSSSFFDFLCVSTSADRVMPICDFRFWITWLEPSPCSAAALSAGAAAEAAGSGPTVPVSGSTLDLAANGDGTLLSSAGVLSEIRSSASATSSGYAFIIAISFFLSLYRDSQINTYGSATASGRHDWKSVTCIKAHLRMIESIGLASDVAVKSSSFS